MKTALHQDPRVPTELVRTSVIIPYHNSPAELGDCLSALARVNQPHAEYIVVDDGSDQDPTPVISRSGLPVRVIRLTTPSGAAAARNQGARVAVGEILVFLDADVCVHHDTVALIEASFAQPDGPTAIIGSYDANPSELGFHSQFRNLLHHYIHQTGRRQACTFWTGCGAVYRNIFESHGGFDERLGGMDDIDFGGRLARAGARIDLRPDIQVQHRKHWTFWLWTTTDLRLRGIPWTMLLLRDSSFPDVLNLEYRNRASVALMCAAMIAVAVGVVVPGVAWLALPLSVAALWFSRRLYAFFRDRRGSAFATASVAAHSIHLLICGLSFMCGAVCFAFSPRGPRSSKPANDLERAAILKNFTD